MIGSLSPRILALFAAFLFAWGATAAPVSPAFAQGGAKPTTGAKKPPPKGGKGAKGNKGAKGKKGKKGAKGKKKDGVGPFKKKDYPTSERLRPLVLPANMGEVGADLTIGRALDTTTAGLGASFGYGIGDVAEIGVATGLLLAPNLDWNRSLLLRGHYLAYDSKQFDFAPGLLVPILAFEGAPFGVVIDLPSRYVLSDGLFLRFGQGAIPVGLSPGFSLSVVANGGVGYQINPKTVLFADLYVFSLNVAPDFSGTGLWDQLNMSLGGQYTPVREWDVGGALNLNNTWQVENSFGFGLTLYGRYRF